VNRVHQNFSGSFGFEREQHQATLQQLAPCGQGS
jgi:hypothetical protein